MPTLYCYLTYLEMSRVLPRNLAADYVAEVYCGHLPIPLYLLATRGWHDVNKVAVDEKQPLRHEAHRLLPPDRVPLIVGAHGELILLGNLLRQRVRPHDLGL